MQEKRQSLEKNNQADSYKRKNTETVGWEIAILNPGTMGHFI